MIVVEGERVVVVSLCFTVDTEVETGLAEVLLAVVLVALVSALLERLLVALGTVLLVLATVDVACDVVVVDGDTLTTVDDGCDVDAVDDGGGAGMEVAHEFTGSPSWAVKPGRLSRYPTSPGGSPAVVSLLG